MVGLSIFWIYPAMELLDTTGRNSPMTLLGGRDYLDNNRLDTSIFSVHVNSSAARHVNGMSGNVPV